MDILWSESWPARRIPNLDFDADGPRIGARSLLAKTKHGLVPRPREDLDALLRDQFAEASDSKRLHERLAMIARALNAGDLALAAIATSHLRLQVGPAAGLEIASLRKASADDPVRPGWPAKTPGSRGGKFRPKDAQGAFDPAREADRVARFERLQARRGIRAALRRILSAKRIGRLVLEGLGEAIPGLDALDTAALVEDVAEIAAEVIGENVDVDAAKAFVEKGPRALEDLTMSVEDDSFSSFEAFKKIEIEKRFGSAGDGYEYHHIVEQSADFPQAQLQSTSNIVRIPKLLHEDVNAEYARVSEDTGTSLRRSLAGKSFDEQRTAGLDVLRKLGILYP